MPTGKCKNCGMMACASVLCKQHLSKTAVTSAGKKIIAKKPPVKPAAKPAGITKAKAPAPAKVPANKAVEKQPEKNTDCFVLISDEGEGMTDVIGVFSKWSPLVKKAQAIMKKKGVTLRCVDDDSGHTGTIPPEPFPAELKHAICLATGENDDSNFSIYVQRKKVQ